MPRLFVNDCLRGMIASSALFVVAVHQPLLAQTEKPTEKSAEKKDEEKIDFDRARQLYQKKQQGEKLTDDEEAYIKKAIAARNAAQSAKGNSGSDGEKIDFDRARQLYQKRQNGEKLTDEEDAYLKKAQAARQAANTSQNNQPDGEKIDFERARGLMQKRQRGEKLTDDEDAFLRKAQAAFQRQQTQNAPTPREKTGLKPLNEMTPEDRYKNQDGGLYGGGQNQPPETHRRAAEAELARIEPLNAEGRPAADGRIVFLSISMSNATQEFSRFKQLADADPAKSEKLTIVDGAQGGQAMAQWVPVDGRPWKVVDQRLEDHKVTAKQVQVAWIKLANVQPRGELTEHGRQLQRDTQIVLQNAKSRFPNLRIAYLSSRIYGGYAGTPLNPEPYAYEGAFAVRWLIQDQIQGEPGLNYIKDKGSVKAPLLLWGPYLWADGVTPRTSDQLSYVREDLATDGTHPSEAGRTKVAKLMLNFYKTDPLTKSWFTK